MIDEFLQLLYDTPASTFERPVFNPWRDNDPLDADTVEKSTLWPWMGPQGRRARLRNHLDCQADFVLIGEAPGYQGAHFSGVAFTSEPLIIANQVPRIVASGERITKRDKPFNEPSATIVWRALYELGIQERTVMWNAFPFHPHEPDKPLSNRTPTKRELLAGVPLLSKLLDLHPFANLVAIGKKSQELLGVMGFKPDACVRHPAYGGATQFSEGLCAFVRSCSA